MAARAPAPNAPAGSVACAAGVLLLMALIAWTPGVSFTEDLGRHLLLGRIISEQHAVPRTNLLTYTYPDFPFVNHHWLSEVFLYHAHRLVGLNGLIVWKAIMLAGTLSLREIVNEQAGTWWGFIPRWYIFLQPLGFLIYMTAGVAETNRAPFDFPEAEQELVAGYHTEYSSMSFAMFFLAEYVNMVTVSAVATSLYLGGWLGPLLPAAWERGDHAEQSCQEKVRNAPLLYAVGGVQSQGVSIFNARPRGMPRRVASRFWPTLGRSLRSRHSPS